MAMVGRCKRFLIYTLQAAPCAYMLFINLFKDMLNILFAGNLPEDQLQKNYTSVDYISGIGLSICLLNIFTYAIHYGIINVLDNSLYNLSSNKKYHIVA